MTDIVKEALKQHERVAPGTEINWNVVFVNGHAQRGTLKSLDGGKYALFNSIGPVYFFAEKVAYLFPS